MEHTYVKRVALGNDLESRVALVAVQIGDVEIRGLSIWKLRSGKLRAYWPKYWDGEGRADAISLPYKLRTEVENEAIAAYEVAQRKYEERIDDQRPIQNRIRTESERSVA